MLCSGGNDTHDVLGVECTTGGGTLWVITKAESCWKPTRAELLGCSRHRLLSILECNSCKEAVLVSLSRRLASYAGYRPPLLDAAQVLVIHW